MERAEAEAIYEQGREAVVAVLLALSAQVAALEARLAKQEERIAELERRLSRNSRNSSLPPSADPPGAPARKRPSPADRKRGGQRYSTSMRPAGGRAATGARSGERSLRARRFRIAPEAFGATPFPR